MTLSDNLKLLFEIVILFIEDELDPSWGTSWLLISENTFKTDVFFEIDKISKKVVKIMLVSPTAY